MERNREDLKHCSSNISNYSVQRVLLCRKTSTIDEKCAAIKSSIHVYLVKNDACFGKPFLFNLFSCWEKRKLTTTVHLR